MTHADATSMLEAVLRHFEERDLFLEGDVERISMTGANGVVFTSVVLTNGKRHDFRMKVTKRAPKLPWWRRIFR